MVDRNKHKIDVVKLKDKFELDIEKYFTRKNCSLYDFDINDFLKEYTYYSEFIIDEIKIKTTNLYKGYNDFVESYKELIILFKINNEITPMKYKRE